MSSRAPARVVSFRSTDPIEAVLCRYLHDLGDREQVIRDVRTAAEQFQENETATAAAAAWLKRFPESRWRGRGRPFNTPRAQLALDLAITLANAGVTLSGHRARATPTVAHPTDNGVLHALLEVIVPEKVTHHGATVNATLKLLALAREWHTEGTRFLPSSRYWDANVRLEPSPTPFHFPGFPGMCLVAVLDPSEANNSTPPVD